ncbi:hypothetical protein JXB28_00060 [Candidatus Woesearchaeota archaeon]|nr:hypothetical protein [Candidatus Woesearchaeota archaeon]
MKKAQAAMEFLMTYGWAILVVLAAIGALAYFGVLSPDRFMPSKCTITGGFSCIEYKLQLNETGTHQLRLYIQNNLGVDTETGSVDVTLVDKNGLACTGADNTGLTIANGQKSSSTTPITFTGCSLTGTTFKGIITITYTKSGEAEQHTASGEISGRFED